MDDITEDSCVIDYAVMHMVDNRNERLALADLPLRLDDEQGMFLRKHILKSIAQSNIAIFDDRESNPVSQSCEQIFAAPNKLADESQDLARRLFDLTKPKTIKPGTFWAIVFGDRNNSTLYLA